MYLVTLHHRHCSVTLSPSAPAQTEVSQKAPYQTMENIPLRLPVPSVNESQQLKPGGAAHWHFITDLGLQHANMFAVSGMFVSRLRELTKKLQHVHLQQSLTDLKLTSVSQNSTVQWKYRWATGTVVRFSGTFTTHNIKKHYNYKIHQ